MKRKSIGTLIIIFMLISTLQLLNNLKTADNTLKQEDSYIDGLKTSAYFDLTPAGIEIGGDGGWALAESTWDYCNGSGTKADPYVIWNVVTDCTGYDQACIKVSSSQVYFIIQNCTLTQNNKAAIHIEYCKNGKVVDTRCDGGQIELQGSENMIIESNEIEEGHIYLKVSSNCEIKDNSISDSKHEGIHLNKECDDNVISGNIIKNVGNFGINVNEESKGNEISDNKIEKSGEDGILLDEATDNEISDNTIKGSGGNGITLTEGSDSNEIIDNIIKDNAQYGIILRESDNNLISGNTFETNTLGCINEVNCQGNTFENNAGCFYPYDRYLIYVSIGAVVIIIVVVIIKRKRS